MQIDKLRETLKIDCQKCQGLCCVALYFSKIDGFPENKMAGCPCKHLKDDFQCDIYDKLNEHCLKGCIAYDCFGAGQIITSKINDTVSKDNIYQAFSIMIQLQQMLSYLIDAYTLYPLQEIENLIYENKLFIEMNIEQLCTLDIDQYHNRVSLVLKKICNEYPRYKQAMKNGKHKRFDNLDFSMQVLIGQDFRQCTFKNSIFLGTDLRDVNMCGADLSESLFLTQIQINAMRGNHKTKIPDYFSRPRSWGKGDSL